MTAIDTAPAEQLAPAHDEDPLADRVLEPGRHGAPKVEKQRAPLPSWAFITAWILVVVAFLSLWAVLYGLRLSAVEQHRNQSVLYSQLREDLSNATAPLGGTITPGTPLALINAPDLGISNLVVVEGTTSAELTRGPGHRADTVMPGQAGVSVLMGRSATYGAPFGDIARAAAGTTITVTTGQGPFTYKVDRVRRPGDTVPVPPTADQSRLVLMTASANSWAKLASPSSNMVLVDATLQGKAAPAPGGRPTSIPQAAKPMQGMPAAAVPLLLWLQGLLLVVLGCLWAQARWGRRETWIAGFPLVLALLWGATHCAMLLLPNLI